MITNQMSKTLMVGTKVRGEIRKWEWAPGLIVSDSFVSVPESAMVVCLQKLSNGVDVLETIRRFLDSKSTHEWTTFGDPKSDASLVSWEYGALGRLNTQDLVYLMQACALLGADRIAYAAANYFVNVVHLQPPKTTQYQLQPLVHGGAGF